MLHVAHATLRITPEDRAWLLRYCAALAPHRDVAEDLAQETLLEAWRNQQKLTDPAGQRAWLAAIARNVALRLRRAVAIDQRNVQELTAPASDIPALADIPAADDDLTLDLERAELADLLDRALAQLAPATRLALIAHYIDDLPQAEIAQRLHLTEGALAVRLHRGKLTLRRLLATDLADEARGLALPTAPTDAWETTSIWCPMCGQRRLQGLFDRALGHLRLRCPACVNGTLLNHLHAIRGVKTYRAALTQVMRWCRDYFPPVISSRQARCISCGKLAPVRFEDVAYPTATPLPRVSIDCECGIVNNCSFAFLPIISAAGEQFIRAHPRVRFATPRIIETQGVAALALGYADVTSAARFTALIQRDTLEPLRIETTG
jgi:RNA polymerase sigma-70 factor (ECF subfamily)